MSSTQLTRTNIGDWLRGRVVTYGELAPDSFSDDTPFADLGFTSVYALTLCGDIEDTFGLVVEPTIVWHHPTIRELADALEGLLERR
ncbi:acyl carrier protein [Streptomyces sp. ISL-98]|uniref:acyl carrier protein n=1 Tax=Streptomyces sp. ISL-98 TaxID=2819192 RepID=UPI001BEBC2AC|nr:acyl carrier protein [Streptomyces sp. ISL-98]MBT2509713.1 acyl carrier protein [Streptomyces sp. ISL-98]